MSFYDVFLVAAYSIRGAHHGHTPCRCDRAVLLSWARRRKTAQGLALRARIVLACADSAATNTAIVEAMGLSLIFVVNARGEFSFQRHTVKISRLPDLVLPGEKLALSIDRPDRGSGLAHHLAPHSRVHPDLPALTKRFRRLQWILNGRQDLLRFTPTHAKGCLKSTESGGAAPSALLLDVEKTSQPQGRSICMSGRVARLSGCACITSFTPSLTAPFISI
jgi:hypothetical protein